MGLSRMYARIAASDFSFGDAACRVSTLTIFPPKNACHEAIAVPAWPLSHLGPQFRPWIFRRELLHFLPKLTDFEITRLRHHNLHFHNLIAAYAFLGRRR